MDESTALHACYYKMHRADMTKLNVFDCTNIFI